MKSFVSSLEIINEFIPNPNIFLWIAASVADAAPVNLNGITTLVVNGLIKFPIKGNTVFGNSPKCLPNDSFDCPIYLSFW